MKNVAVEKYLMEETQTADLTKLKSITKYFLSTTENDCTTFTNPRSVLRIHPETHKKVSTSL
jgi:hypothetical protein